MGNRSYPACGLFYILLGLRIDFTFFKGLFKKKQYRIETVYGQ